LLSAATVQSTVQLQQLFYLPLFLVQVLQEGTVKPLYHILGSTVTSQEETFSRTKSGLALVSGKTGLASSMLKKGWP